MYTHFPYDPQCEVCRANKVHQADRHSRGDDRRPDAIPLPKRHAEQLTMDHKILKHLDESRGLDRVALIIVDKLICWYQDTQRPKKC